MSHGFSFPNYGLFNATYYLQQNPDVATSWTGTPLQHYIQFGALEGRAPTAWFNADFYRASYTDLQSMNALQLFNHYCNYGFNEGRVPMLNFSNFNGARYLLDNPDVAAAGYTAADAVSHYVVYGEYEGRVAYATNGVVIDPVVNEGGLFPLTLGVDSIPGTQFNDTFDASIAGTLQSFDSLDGMGGTDTLYATVTGNVTPARLANMEVISATATAIGTLNLINGGQVTNVNNNGSTAALTVSNIAAGADLAVSNTATATQFDYATVTGTQSANLTIDGVTGGADITIAGVETLNVTSTGNAANVADIIAAAATTVGIDGAADLNISGAATNLDAATLIDASGMVGDLTIEVSPQVSNTTATIVRGGLGDDTFVVTGTQIGTGTVASTLNGGLGNNTISATFAADQANVVDAGSITITNIQNVDLIASDDTKVGTAVDLGLNATLVGGLATVGVSAQDLSDANIFTITGLTASQNVSVDQVAVGGGAQLELAVGTGVTAVNVGLNAGATLLATQDVRINEEAQSTAITTVNLSTDGNSYGAVDLEAASFTTLNVTGGKAAQTLVMGGAVALDQTTINASAFSSNFDATIGAAATSITGGSGNDIFRFGANLGATDSVDGGAGSNTVAFTAGATITPTLTNIQTVDLTSNVAGAFNAVNSTSLTKINNLVVSAGNATVTNLVSGVTFANADTTNAVTIDTVAAANLTYTALADAGALTVADVASLTINAANTAAAGDVNSVTLDNVDTTSLTVTGANTAFALTTGNILNTNALGSLTVSTSTANGTALVGTVADATALTTLSITASGANATVGAVGTAGAATVADALQNLTLNALGAVATVGAIAADTSTDSTTDLAMAISASANSAGKFVIGAIDNGFGSVSGTLTSDNTAVASTLGAVLATSIDLTVAGAGDVTLTQLDTLTPVLGANVNLTVTSTGDVVVSDVDADGNAVINASGMTSKTSTLTLVLDDVDGTATVTTGAGASEITTADGTINTATNITLGSANGVVDTINLNATNSGSVSVTNFVHASDVLELSVTGWNAATGDTAVYLATGNGTPVLNTQAVGLQTITGAYDLGGAGLNNVLVVDGTFALASQLVTALQDGGTYALKAEGVWTAGTDAMFVLWDDGSNSYLSSYTGTAADEGTFAGGSMTTVLTLVGISDATTVNAADLGTAFNA